MSGRAKALAKGRARGPGVWPSPPLPSPSPPRRRALTGGGAVGHCAPPARGNTAVLVDKLARLNTALGAASPACLSFGAPARVVGPRWRRGGGGGAQGRYAGPDTRRPLGPCGAAC